MTEGLEMTRGGQVLDGPEVSVVIPCYNAAAVIGEQLKALSAQVGAPRFEVIVADNGSADDLSAVCRSFEDQLALRIVDASAMRGAAFARNMGVKQARAGIVIFCDADDVVSPEWVAAMSAPLAADDCVVSGSLLGWDGDPDFLLQGHEGIDDGPYRKGSTFPFAPSGNSGYRRATYVSLGGTELGYRGGCEDVDLAWRAQERGLPLVFVPEALIYYRQRSTPCQMLVQHYRFTREDVRLWRMAQKRGHESYLVSLKGSITRLATVPSLLAGMRSEPTNVATLGCIAGSLAGHVAYRLMQRDLAASVLDPQWFDDPDSGDEVEPWIRRAHSPVPARGERPSQVVFLVNSMCAPNGVVSSVDCLAQEFDRRGIPVKILDLGESDDVFVRRYDLTFLRPLIRFTTDVHDFENSRPVLKGLRRGLSRVIMPWERRRARRVVHQIPQDALVVAAGMECLEFLSAAAAVPGFVVAQLHLSLSGLSPDQWDRMLRCSALASRLSVFDETDAERLEQEGLGRGLVLPNICPAPKLESLPAKSKDVVFVGRLAEEKQVEQLVRAFQDAAAPGWRLRIFGKGPEEARIAALAESTSVDIRMEGFTSDVLGVFESASIQALTSRVEGLPMSILEAAAMGTPTLAYDCAPGVGVAVGEHGLAVPLDDLSTFTRHLGEWMRNEVELRERQKSALTDRRFTASRIGDLWLSAWSEHRRAQGIAPIEGNRSA